MPPRPRSARPPREPPSDRTNGFPQLAGPAPEEGRGRGPVPVPGPVPAGTAASRRPGPRAGQRRDPPRWAGAALGRGLAGPAGGPACLARLLPAGRGARPGGEGVGSGDEEPTEIATLDKETVRGGRPGSAPPRPRCHAGPLGLSPAHSEALFLAGWATSPAGRGAAAAEPCGSGRRQPQARSPLPEALVLHRFGPARGSRAQRHRPRCGER